MTIYVIKGVFILELTFKDRENIIRRYGNDYKKSKLIELNGLELLYNNIVSEKNGCLDGEAEYQYYYGLQTKIDRILDKMDYESANFIRYEFLSNNYKSDWWMNYFSRSTYYRMKKKSMNNFLELLYD